MQLILSMQLLTNFEHDVVLLTLYIIGDYWYFLCYKPKPLAFCCQRIQVFFNVSVKFVEFSQNTDFCESKPHYHAFFDVVNIVLTDRKRG